jgi:hypothetical protein
MIFFMGWLSNTYGWNPDLLKWIIFPVISYLVAFGFNALTQVISCRTVQFPKVALLSLIVPGFILIAFLLTLLSFVRSPIEIALPLSARSQYGGMVALAFYTFWATMFGEAFSAGYMTDCPSP